MPIRKRQHGFTLVELLVTMSILGLMLFLVNQLFNDTSRAVTTSVQTSKVIAQSRSINEQITQDADAMVGPGDPVTDDGPGYIVIIQERLTNATMRDPQTLGQVTVGELRIDQLLFIRDAEGLKSMTPSTTTGYTANFIGMPGDRAKVWYGHPLRTQNNGLPRTGAGTTLGGANAYLDRVGSDFILGRQAMLFNPTDVSLATPAKLSANPAAYSHADSFFYNSSVSGSGFGAGAQVYLGLSDVTELNYSDALTALTNGVGDAAGSPNDNGDYFRSAYPDAAGRLRVNPAPSADGTDFSTWAIAQSHPILAQSCSELIIDFAADMNGDGRIDTDFGGQGPAGSPIWWYDGLKQPNVGNSTFGGTWVTQPGVDQPQRSDTATLQRFIFRIEDDTSFEDASGTIGTPGTAHSYWPYLIRIRYRLHDTRGRLTSNYAAALRDGIDNDGDGNPDAAGGGTDTDEDKISGRWFERIISVPRP